MCNPEEGRFSSVSDVLWIVTLSCLQNCLILFSAVRCDKSEHFGTFTKHQCVWSLDIHARLTPKRNLGGSKRCVFASCVRFRNQMSQWISWWRNQVPLTFAKGTWCFTESFHKDRGDAYQLWHVCVFIRSRMAIPRNFTTVDIMKHYSHFVKACNFHQRFRGSVWCQRVSFQPVSTRNLASQSNFHGWTCTIILHQSDISSCCFDGHTERVDQSLMIVITKAHACYVLSLAPCSMLQNCYNS